MNTQTSFSKMNKVSSQAASEASVQPSNPSKTKTPMIYKVLVVVGLLSLIIGSLTGVMTYVTFEGNLSSDFGMSWLKSFGLGLAFLPVGLILMRVITCWVEYRLFKGSQIKQNLLTGLIMATLMEGIFAVASALSTVGLTSQPDFWNAWLNGFLAALPLGLVIMLLMTLLVKPRMEAFLQS